MSAMPITCRWYLQARDTFCTKNCYEIVKKAEKSLRFFRFLIKNLFAIDTSFFLDYNNSKLFVIKEFISAV